MKEVSPCGQLDPCGLAEHQGGCGSSLNHFFCLWMYRNVQMYFHLIHRCSSITIKQAVQKHKHASDRWGWLLDFWTLCSQFQLSEDQCHWYGHMLNLHYLTHWVLVEQVLANRKAPQETFSRCHFESCTQEMNENIKSNIKLQSKNIMMGSIYSTPISMVMWFYSYCLSNSKFGSDEPWSKGRTAPDCSIVSLWPSLLIS